MGCVSALRGLSCRSASTYVAGSDGRECAGVGIAVVVNLVVGDKGCVGASSKKSVFDSDYLSKLEKTVQPVTDILASERDYSGNFHVAALGVDK
jgi:hypothetical protein